MARDQMSSVSSGKDSAATVGNDHGGTRPGSAPRCGVQDGTSKSAKALRSLLQATALCSCKSGWRDVFYTGLAGVLCTASAGMLVLTTVTYGPMLMRAGKPLVYIVSFTEFLGIQFVVMWLSLMICFVVSRRPYGELLLTIGNLKERNVLLASASASANRLGKRLNWLLFTLLLFSWPPSFLPSLV